MATPVLIRPLRKLTYNNSIVVNGQQVGNSIFTDILADAVPLEEHDDEMVITDQPVEQGSVVQDHAYKLPARLTLEYVWSPASALNINSDPTFLNTLYQTMLTLEANSTLFQVYTGKRRYNNMMVEALNAVSDPDNENVLKLRITLKQILIVTTQLVLLNSADNQAVPQKTAPVVNFGTQNVLPAQNFNSSGGAQ